MTGRGGHRKHPGMSMMPEVRVAALEREACTDRIAFPAHRGHVKAATRLLC